MTAPVRECQPEADGPRQHAPEVFLFYREGQLHHIHTDRKVFEDWMERSPWQYPPDRCEIVRYAPEARIEELTKALETAAGRFNMMGGVGLVNGTDPKVGYRECMDTLRGVAPSLEDRK